MEDLCHINTVLAVAVLMLAQFAPIRSYDVPPSGGLNFVLMLAVFGSMIYAHRAQCGSSIKIWLYLVLLLAGVLLFTGFTVWEYAIKSLGVFVGYLWIYIEERIEENR